MCVKPAFLLLIFPFLFRLCAGRALFREKKKKARPGLLSGTGYQKGEARIGHAFSAWRFSILRQL